MSATKQLSLSQIVLILVLIFISAVFLIMVRSFLMTLLLTSIFAAMTQPVYKKFLQWTRNRANLSSALTLVCLSLIIFLPLLVLLGIIAGQAVKISQSVTPWVAKTLQETSTFDDFFQKLPYYEEFSRYQDIILQKAGEMVSNLSSLLFDSISSFTFSTVNFLFMSFVFLYTMYFFLKDGKMILDKLLLYFPLTDQDERRMLAKFTSVTRATIKGTLVIGAIKGGLAGLAFWVVGIDSVLFWATVMTVLSIIPIVGSSLIWIPAVILLAASGAILKAVGLALFCGLLVGSVDNVLRPRLVGKDTRMHDLMIFFSTLGGISLFGIVGFIVGPIIAALFVTVWDIYGETFRAYLPEVRKADEVGFQPPDQGVPDQETEIPPDPPSIEPAGQK